MTLGLPSWSTVAADNNQATPYGISGTDAVSTVDNWGRQVMDSVKEFYIDAQWVSIGIESGGYVAIAPVYVSATSFTIAGNATSLFTPYRKIKLYGTTFGTHTGVIISSSYSSPNTTVSVMMDDGALLTSNISLVYLGSLSPAISTMSISASNGTLIGAAAFSNWVSSPKNIIIGGNFDTNPWQRQVTFTSPTTGTYLADNFTWRNATAGAVTVTKAASAPSIALSGTYSTSSLRATVTTADTSIATGDFCGISYNVEGYDALNINHQLYTLGFWVRATKTGINCVAFRNSGLDRAYIGEYAVNTTLTWEYKRITLIESSSSGSGTWNYTTGIGLQIFFALACGATYQTTANAWQSGNYLATSNQINNMDANGNIFEIQLVSLTKGLSTFNWIEQDSIGDTLRKCQRYYYKTYAQGVYPGAANSENVGYTVGVGFSQKAIMNFPLPVTQRAVGTSTIYSTVTGTSGNMRNITAGNDAAAIVIANGSDRVTFATTANSTSGDAFAAHLVVESPIT